MFSFLRGLSYPTSSLSWHALHMASGISPSFLSLASRMRGLFQYSSMVIFLMFQICPRGVPSILSFWQPQRSKLPSLLMFSSNQGMLQNILLLGIYAYLLSTSLLVTTLSASPYDTACSAVMKLSRSMSACNFSSGWPVCF